MALVKAMIEILDRGAIDDGRGLPQFIHVQFNPTEYSLAKSATFAEIAIPSLDTPVLQFVRGQSEKLTLELFLDTTENGLAEPSMDNGRHLNPVFAGDTLFAESVVMRKRDSPDRPDGGIVSFKLLGRNQDGKVVLEIDREVLVKRKSHYLEH
jgi:hypothetical protein